MGNDVAYVEGNYELTPEERIAAMRCVNHVLADQASRIEVLQALGLLPTPRLRWGTKADGKRCSHCKDWKTYDQFWRNRTSSDGHHKMCKTCHGHSGRRNAERRTARTARQMRVRAQNGVSIDA
jgi:hypothetical protein